MKLTERFTILFIFLLIPIIGYSQGYHKRIAFIGNSITAGYTLTDVPHDRFSTLVDTMLRQTFGDTCIVANYAVSGRTMLKHGDFPLWNEQQFTDCWQFAPDIVIILLGTNDSKPYNWDPYGDEFYDDYISMVDTLKLRNPQAKFIVCLPPPAFQVVFDIRDSVIINGVVPLIDSVAKVTGATTLDFYHPLLDSVNLFSDYIHPNKEGHQVMAKMIYDTLIQSDYIHQIDTGYTFVNHFASSTAIASEKDSVTLSWTTINADSAFLDGKAVPLDGSRKVNATGTTTYTLKAMGKLSTDSVQLVQEFYHPLLSKMTLGPANKTLHESDTVQLTLKFQDQHKKYITDTVYTVNWSIVSGDGVLIDKTSNSAKFIAGAAGSAKVTAQVDTIVSNTANITINPALNIVDREATRENLFLYPNPVNDLLNASVQVDEPSTVKIKIYDVTGVMQIQEDQYFSNAGEHKLTINMANLPKGVYFFEIAFADKYFVRKFTVLGNR